MVKGKVCHCFANPFISMSWINSNRDNIAFSDSHKGHPIGNSLSRSHRPLHSGKKISVPRHRQGLC